MTKTDRRAAKRAKSRYGHAGSGSSHTRTASEAEVRRHITKIRKRGRGR
jgi:hypothetical protein